MRIVPTSQSSVWVARLGLLVLVWLLLGLVTSAPLFFGRRGWWNPVLQPIALWVHVYVSLVSVPFLAAKIWGTWNGLWHGTPGRYVSLTDRSASAATGLLAVVVYGSGGLLVWNAAAEGNAWLKDVHLYSTLAMAAPLTWHLARRLRQSWDTVRALASSPRPGAWRAALYSRRDILAMSLLAGLALATDRLVTARASEDPNDFPVTNFGPPPTSMDLAAWRLKIAGAVENPLELTYEELMRMPREIHRYPLDCVTGWSATRDWEGIPLSKLIEMARPASPRPSLHFLSATGYEANMSFSTWSRNGGLIATHVGGVPFTHEHGFPARIMVPGVVGEDNVKWLTQIRVIAV